MRSLADLGRTLHERGEAPIPLLHAGGEILDCDAWQAAVMLLDAGEAARVAVRLGAKPAERDAWARRTLAQTLRIPAAAVPRAPYVVSRTWSPQVGPVVFGAVGGVGLSRCDAALRAEVLAALRAAAHVAVRDGVTQARLHAHGIDAALAPDPAVMVETLFGARIRARASDSPDLVRVAETFPDGWLAIQLSADFGDDATLSTVAAQLDGVAGETRLGLVLFRAGAAPWHDALDVLERLAARLRTPSLVFRSIDVGDLCALLAGSRGFCGSSLHGRIVASAFGRARVNVAHPSARDLPTKQHAYCTTWEPEGQPGVVPIEALGDGLRSALAVDRAVRTRHARALAARYREAFEPIRSALARRARGDIDSTIAH